MSGIFCEKISDIIVLATDKTAMPVQATEPKPSQICQNWGVRMTLSICTLLVLTMGFSLKGEGGDV